MGSNQKRMMTWIRVVAVQIVKSRRTEGKLRQREKTWLLKEKGMIITEGIQDTLLTPGPQSLGR